MPFCAQKSPWGNPKRLTKCLGNAWGNPQKLTKHFGSAWGIPHEVFFGFVRNRMAFIKKNPVQCVLEIATTTWDL